MSLLVVLTGSSIAGALVWGPRIELADSFLLYQSLVAGFVVGASIVFFDAAETRMAEITMVHLSGSALLGVGLGFGLGSVAGMGNGFPAGGAGAMLFGTLVGAIAMRVFGESFTSGGVSAIVFGAIHCYISVLLLGVFGPFQVNVAGIALIFSTLWLSIVVYAGNQEASHRSHLESRA